MSFIRSVATPALSKNKRLMSFQAGLVCDWSVFYVSGQFKFQNALYLCTVLILHFIIQLWAIAQERRMIHYLFFYHL